MTGWLLGLSGTSQLCTPLGAVHYTRLGHDS